jgi:actin-related protein
VFIQLGSFGSLHPPEQLCLAVILTGGASNLKDIHKRLHWELLALIPAAFKPRVIAPSAIEREFATWIGGSVLGMWAIYSAVCKCEWLSCRAPFLQPL